MHIPDLGESGTVVADNRREQGHRRAVQGGTRCTVHSTSATLPRSYVSVDRLPKASLMTVGRWRSWLSHLSNTQKVLSSILGRLIYFYFCLDY